MTGQDARVLVVDDDTLLRAVVTITLEDAGYRVNTACNGAEALRVAEEHEPDAIILDAMMPVMDGWEFLARWRTRPAERRAPVLVISAAREKQAALDRGATAYLSKPFDLETLEMTLASIL
jgi:CheY-like chemotaxis protein